MRKLLLISPLLLFGCTNGIDLNEIFYDSLLHDDNSKVWVVNQLVVDGVNMANPNDNYKDVIVFHSNKNVNMIPMKGLGDSVPKRGRYLLDSKNREMIIEFDDAEWALDIDYIYEDSIYFTPKKGKNPYFELQLIPFPEL